MPLDIQDSPSGQAVAPFVQAPRPPREFYDLLEDPCELNNLLIGDENERVELIADDLAVRLHEWREETGDVIPSEFAGPRIHVQFTETVLQILGMRPTSRSAIASERGITEPRSTQ
jgi:hypothetical protein